jgi:hypothetical protein
LVSQLKKKGVNCEEYNTEHLKKYGEEYMPAIATLEELKAIDIALKKMKEEYPEAYEKLSRFFKDNRQIGYKNIIKMMIGEATPEKLKGVG